MTFSYHKIKGFEIRHAKTTTSTFNAIKPEDHLFELRIRHKDPELIQALKEKILDLIE